MSGTRAAYSYILTVDELRTPIMFSPGRPIHPRTLYLVANTLCIVEMVCNNNGCDRYGMIRCVATSGVAVHLNNGHGSWLHLCRHTPGKMCTYMDRTILITHRCVRRSTAGPKSSDLET